MRRYLWLLAVPIALIAIAVVYAARRQSLQISYEEVTAGPLDREVLTSGTLEPAREVEVGAQVAGTVQSLHADFNSRVKSGQVIAQLDPSVYDAELAQARARVIEAQGNAQRAQLTERDMTTKRDRARELASKDLVPATDLESAELAAKQASADLIAAQAAATSAQAALKQAEVNRSHTTIRSPIDGIVVSRNVEVGQTLAVRLESPVLFRIADLSRMHLLAEIGEAEVGGVVPGAEVAFEIESLGPQRFEGKVSEVRLQPVLQAAVATTGSATTSGATTATAPAASSAPRAPGTQGTAQPQTTANTPPQSGAVVSYTAIVDVDNRDWRIAPGSTALVLLPTAQRSRAVRLPNNALTFRPPPAVLEITRQKSLRVDPIDRDSPTARGVDGHVWRYENEKFVPVKVRTGVADERWTELIDGAVQPGDRLVTAARQR
ncbi:MAG TPA: efflux RND transporter periplasmic adaptor subunit [Vicinamibacterales bacterium]